MSLVDAASRLTTKFGKDITLVQKTASGDYDPSGRTSPNTTVNRTFKGVVLNFRTDEIDGTIITSEDHKVILVAKGAVAVPKTKDDIEFDTPTKKRTIVSVRTVEVSGNDIIYELQVR